MDEFLNRAVEVALGIIIAVVFIVMVVSIFADWVFGMLGDIRISWRRHMRSRNQ